MKKYFFAICLFIIIFITIVWLFKFTSEDIIKKYSNVQPKEWSENIQGVIKTLPTNEKVLALTLDACGSKNDSLDEDLITFLINNEIPATIFVNYRWIKKYPEKFKKLYTNNLFEIGNHGYRHIPASLSGNSIYGIIGTKNSKELFDEIEINAGYIQKITGYKPKFFRSGTAYYDEYAVKQIYDMGFIPVGFNILGDAGATYSKEQVKQALLKSKPADIIIAHVNHPEKQTGKGLKIVLPLLKEKGYKFVKLKDYIK